MDKIYSDSEDISEKSLIKTESDGSPTTTIQIPSTSKFSPRRGARNPIYSAHKPSYGMMVDDAIEVLNEKNGSSLAAIKKYVKITYDISSEMRSAIFIKKYIKSALNKNHLIFGKTLQRYKLKPIKKKEVKKVEKKIKTSEPKKVNKKIQGKEVKEKPKAEIKKITKSPKKLPTQSKQHEVLSESSSSDESVEKSSGKILKRKLQDTSKNETEMKKIKEGTIKKSKPETRIVKTKTKTKIAVKMPPRKSIYKDQDNHSLTSQGNKAGHKAMAKSRIAPKKKT